MAETINDIITEMKRVKRGEAVGPSYILGWANRLETAATGTVYRTINAYIGENRRLRNELAWVAGFAGSSAEMAKISGYKGSAEAFEVIAKRAENEIKREEVCNA